MSRRGANEQVEVPKQPKHGLNDAFLEGIANLPKLLLANALKDKLAKAGHNVNDEVAQAFAAHLFNNPDEEFEWDDNSVNDIQIDLEFTEDDISKLEADVEKFSEKLLPDIILKVKDDTVAKILKTLHKDWPNQKAFEAGAVKDFRQRLEVDWGDAFDLLRMMLVISRETGQEYIEWLNSSEARRNSAKYACILKLHARGCQVFMEIICLMENGFADGAFARWRTLHEITIVATLLADGDEGLADRYLAHECIEAKRSMDHFQLNYAALGYDKPTDEEVKRINADYQRCLDLYGHNFGSQHGWASEHLHLKKATFRDLETAVGQMSSRSHYQFASYNVHASAKGINYRLGLVDQHETLLAGMSNVGFFEPGNNAAQTLVQLNAAIMHDRWDFDTLVIFQILLELRKALPPILSKVQNVIECRA